MFAKLLFQPDKLLPSGIVAHETPSGVVTPGSATTFESTSGEKKSSKLRPPGPATKAVDGCLSIHAVYPPAACTTPKMVLVRTKSHGYTGAQPFRGSRTSFLGSSEAIPPSVSPAPGAPPFSLVSSKSTP